MLPASAGRACRHGGLCFGVHNPEFPLPGEGKIFGLKDLESDPEAEQVAKGF